MLPSLAQLELVSEEIKNIPNRQGEYKRKIHYCCYLLCSQSGLRISEAIKFDLNAKNKQGLYRINKPKGKKMRYVYVSPQVIRELKKNNWKPNQTNRHNFYWFLQKIKRKVGISKNTELTPHTLRRSFTTYHAEAGMPLPLLQKWLGHDSVRTTILYWRNPYEKPFADKIPIGDNDIEDILAAKKWLEDKKPPITENFPLKSPKPAIVEDKPLISETNRPDNPPLINTTKKSPTITNYQPKLLANEIQGEFSLKTSQKNDQLENSQSLTITANKEQKPTKKELILSAKIKNLEEQLAQVQAENNNLRSENKHLKALIQQEQETETKIIQQLPFK